MNVVKTLKMKKKRDMTIVGVDASSTAIAFAFLRQKNSEMHLVKTIKIKLNNFSMNDKLKIVSSCIDEFFKDEVVDYIFVEQPIYIQNPATSRILSQISGHLLGKCLEYCENVQEVTIANWKSYIGYKNVSKAEKDAWEREFGVSEAKKIAKNERKERTIRIVNEKFSGSQYIDDNDVCDSIGIALYGLSLANLEE